MSLTIHFGIRQNEMPAFQQQFMRLIENSPFTPQSNGDDWFNWGRQPYHEDPDDIIEQPLHVYIETRTPMVLLNFLVEHFRNFFVPMNGEGYDGVCVIVTDSYETVSDGKPFDEYLELRWPS
jgi:hypothetical protein